MEVRHALLPPSAWVRHWAGLIPAGGRVLDVACGAGRHARVLAGLGFEVEAVDRDTEALARLAGVPQVHTLAADLEGGPWPYRPAQFDGVIVCNYLHRPLFPRLMESLASGGLLIYETFAVGNEAYGRPGNPDFLLKPGELLELASGRLRVIAFEEGLVHEPKTAVVQRICAAKLA